ncbi:MAG TPA: vitamin K epoxide reductase family protein [Poseidonia sp.]|nr:vitamin K epoxide reductase family protein [Poseidonia sp.]
MDANLVLMLYVLPLLFGTALLTPLFPGLGTQLSNNWPTMKIPRRQRLLGLNLVLLIGFAISVHTLWISNKISEGGAVCSSATVFSCDDVLGNAAYNTDPLFGLSWGMIGMFAFGTLLFLANSISKDPDALWAERYAKYGLYLAIIGLPIIALLISYEFAMGKICQYCTTAHIANIIGLFGFWTIGRMHENGTWNDDESQSNTD